MKKLTYVFPFLVALYFLVPHMALALYGPDLQKDQARIQLAQATPAITSTTTETSSPTQPSSVTTVVKGGTLAAGIIEWLQVAFGTVLAGIGSLILIKIRTYFGIQTTEAQKAALQAIIVNGINAAAAEVAEKLKKDPSLDFDVKGEVMAKTIEYAQAHGSQTITALGLDPKSGDAVDAIKARIETALKDPATPASLEPATVTGTVNGVVINGDKV